MAKIFIQTFGCVVNMSDSEVMKGLLNQGGHTFVDDEKSADLLIFNTCTVKGKTEFKFFTLLKKSANKPTIVAGCIPQADKNNPKLKDYSLVGPFSLSHINKAVELTLSGKRVVMLDNKKDPRLNIPKIRKSPIIEIIPICAGCLGYPCTYCIVKSARGNLLSYSPEAIIKQAKSAIKEGVKEIWLTAQDTGCYGNDIGTSLPVLLESLCDLEGEFRVRLGIANPNHIKKHLKSLIKCFKHEKMFKFLHIPVQSGSSTILNSMKRPYSPEDFLSIINAFREEIPMMTFSTDIIVGFPGESEKDFMDSLNLVKESRIDVLNLSKFWPRQGTPASIMKDQIPGETVKARIKLINEAFYKGALENNKRWIGWSGNIIIDEEGKKETNTLIGRNDFYKTVVMPMDKKSVLGDTILVEIEKASKFDLYSKN